MKTISFEGRVVYVRSNTALPKVVFRTFDEKYAGKKHHAAWWKALQEFADKTRLKATFEELPQGKLEAKK